MHLKTHKPHTVHSDSATKLPQMDKSHETFLPWSLWIPLRLLCVACVYCDRVSGSVKIFGQFVKFSTQICGLTRSPANDTVHWQQDSSRPQNFGMRVKKIWLNETPNCEFKNNLRFPSSFNPSFIHVSNYSPINPSSHLFIYSSLHSSIYPRWHPDKRLELRIISLSSPVRNTFYKILIIRE